MWGEGRDGKTCLTPVLKQQMYNDPQVNCTSYLCAFEMKDLKTFSAITWSEQTALRVSPERDDERTEGKKGVSCFKGVANKQSLA